MSSRGSRHAHDSLKVTLDSAVMKQLLDGAAKAAKSGRIVPLVISNEETRELGSFGRQAMSRIERTFDLRVVPPAEPPPLDTEPYNTHGVLVVSSSQVPVRHWEAFGKASAAARLVILCFGSERDLNNVRSKLPAPLTMRMPEIPLLWPRLCEREADHAGIIRRINESLLDAHGNTPDFSAEAINWLLRNTGESVAQLYALMKNGVKMRDRHGVPRVGINHLNAVTKKDQRAKLRDSAPPAA